MLSLHTGRAYGKELHRKSPERRPPLSTRTRMLAELGVLKVERPIVSEKANHDHDLLITQAFVAGQPAWCLIDSGATHNFASQTWIEEAGTTTSERQAQFMLTMADGSQRFLNEAVTPRLQLKIENTSWESLTVIYLGGYDIVLGKPWLTKNNPDIDFANNQVSLSNEPGSPSIPVKCVLDKRYPQENDICPEEFMNIKHARRALKKDAEYIIVKIEEDSPVDNSGMMKMAVDGEKRAELMNVLGKHAGCFQQELPMKLPPSRKTDHEINVETEAKPPSRPPYRLSQPELEELQKQLEKLLKHDFIGTSESPYGAPVFFVKKTDGSLRLVCDWRPLNNITVKTQACPPNIDDLFDTARGAKYFSKLDLMSGYHQARVRERDVPITAINTLFGQFQF